MYFVTDCQGELVARCTSAAEAISLLVTCSGLRLTMDHYASLCVSLARGQGFVVMGGYHAVARVMP